MYKLPKIWLGRIQEIWDKIMPSDYPASSSEFSIKFKDEETTNAVKVFEEQLGTEESVVNNIIPEGTVVSNYIGTYEVTATAGELTLLSPEKITSDNVIALHYNGTEWVKIENTEIKDGYLWGTLEDFSPIAIVEYKKTMHLEDTLPGVASSVCAKVLVCEGNSVKITLEDDKVVARDNSTGISLVLDTPKTYIVGGSIDGSPIKKTNVVIDGLTTTGIISKVVAGSQYVDEGFTTVGEVNLTINNSIVPCMTGSVGAIRTLKVNFNLNNVRTSWIGHGEAFAKVDDSKPTFASRAWIKEINSVMNNVYSSLTFCSQNCEYIYIDSTNVRVTGGSHAYLISGGSNADTKDSVLYVENANVGIFQTTNRGNVSNAKVTFKGCTVENLFVGGDPTDSTVTGTTTKLKYEILQSDNDSYHIQNGTEAGAALTAEDAERIVDSIKVSRSANITIDDDIKAILGNKYIIK